MNKPDNRTDKRKVGDIGENVAVEYLLKKGYEVIKRNYLRKWGEIDIIARRNNIYHFIEVKSSSTPVSHETSSFRPEENVHPQKLKRMYRTIETYMLENKVDAEFQIDVVSARLDMGTRKARVEMIENIIG